MNCSPQCWCSCHMPLGTQGHVKANAQGFTCKCPPVLTGKAAMAEVTDVCYGLTRREVEVARLLGLANKQIAGELGIGSATIKGHVSSIISKTRTSNRTAAALLLAAHLR